MEKRNSMFFIEAKRIAIVILGSFLLAVSLNFFLINANVYASGFSGAAQLASSVFKDFLNIRISTGILLLLFNIPVLILGWFKVGKGFTIYSIISVAFATLFLEILPIISLSEDIILNAVAGGVIGGIGVGLSLKKGASTGGMDIVAMMLSRLHDRSEEHTSELQSRGHLVCRLLLEKKNIPRGTGRPASCRQCG